MRIHGERQSRFHHVEPGVRHVYSPAVFAGADVMLMDNKTMMNP
jgi:hypothetical protein